MATLTFLPWTLAGASAVANTPATTMGHNRPAIQVAVTVTKQLDDGTTSTVLPAGEPAGGPAGGPAGSPTATVGMQLLGPGDILGLAPGQVAKSEPADGATGVLTSVFAAVEFAELALPWLFTPAAENVSWPNGAAPPAGSHRLLPWLCLVVVPDAAGITLDTAACTLTIEAPADARQQLPDLADAWAWAHVQYAGNLDADATGGTGAQPASAASAASTLLAKPASGLSRLLSPRQLAPDTHYFACVVPTFMAGRVAGLGGSPDPTGQATPAWDVSPAGEASLTLPVYHSFSFTTGAGGDFLTLAQLLAHPPALPAGSGSGLGTITLAVTVPGSGSPVELEMPGMLQPAQTAPPTDPSSLAGIQQWLQTELTPSAADPLPELRPTPYGAPQAGITEAQLMTSFAQQPPWFTTLNCDPRLRAAAALGKQVVAAQREELVTAAWAQVEQTLQANALLSRVQLARAVGERLSAKHLPQDPLSFLRVTSPHASRVQVNAGPLVGSVWSVARDPSADVKLAAAISPEYRRLTRPRGPHARNVASSAPPAIAISPGQLTPGKPPFGPDQTVPARAFAERLSPVAAAAAQAAGPADTLRGFAPQVSFPAGMITALEQADSDAILPGADLIPANTALTLQANPAPIAAYMVGLNTEISRLLRWRGVPADPQCTPFAYFWDQRGQAASGQPDIQPIASWAATSALAAQVAGDASGTVLAVRADLLRRYPNAAVFATPAVPAGNGMHTFDISNPANIIQPAFTGALPPDLHLYVFPGIKPQAAIGTPGYFFVFQEQLSESRFGTDPMVKADIAAPAGSYWTSAALATLAAQPAHAGGIASAVRMAPALVAIHARALLPAGG
jgi:hypothetical protein